MPVPPALEVEGIAELRRTLKAAGAGTRDLQQAHKRVSKIVEGGSRRRAPGGTRQQRAAGKVLLGKGTVKGADLSIRNTAKVPFGLGAFLGGKRPQFPEWVGARWDVLAGGGPYVVADAIREDRTEIMDTFAEEIAAVFAAAGLDVS
jgi:hypothetical protein